MEELQVHEEDSRLGEEDGGPKDRQLHKEKPEVLAIEPAGRRVPLVPVILANWTFPLTSSCPNRMR